MFCIKNTLVSLDVVEKEFCCDLDTCRGCCCIEGDAGCPVEPDEEQAIREILPQLLPEMTKEACKVVEEQGIAYDDPSGERVLSIVNDKDCVFARTDHNGWCYCLIEKAYKQGKLPFNKPISCHLYPIRLKTIGGNGVNGDASLNGGNGGNGDASLNGGNGGIVGVEYHRWDICHCGRVLGKKLHLPLYKFLKEPLIRRFGQEWYDELELVASEWKKQMRGDL